MDGVRAAERTLATIDLLAASAPDAVRVADAARHLDVTPASASRLLATLVEHGYAARTHERRYTVGPRSFELATGWVGPLRRAIGPSVARLAAATGEGVGVAQILGDTVMPVLVRVPRGHPVAAAPATDWPLWTTAMGRSLLAALPERDRARLADGRVDRAATRHARRGGLFTEHGETLDEMSCFSVPLATRRGPVIALAVMCDRNGRERVDHVRRHLNAEAERLGTQRIG